MSDSEDEVTFREEPEVTLLDQAAGDSVGTGNAAGLLKSCTAKKSVHICIPSSDDDSTNGEGFVTAFESDSDRKAMNRKKKDRKGRAYIPPKFKLSQYNGDGDWEEYLEDFEYSSEFCQWDSRDKAAVLGRNLEGSAKLYYSNLSPFVKASFIKLVVALEKRYGCSSTIQQRKWERRLMGRKRFSEETPEHLADDILRMTRKAGYEGERLESKSLDFYLDSLPEEYQVACRIQLVESLDHALRLCEVLDADKQKKKYKVNLVHASENNQSTEISQLHCNYCKTKGHLVATCPSLKCLTCGLQGHRKINCPQL